VSNLEKGIAFYRDGLGLEVTGQPSNADDNAPLRDMFGLPGAKLRWTIARPTGMATGIEIIEITHLVREPDGSRLAGNRLSCQQAAAVRSGPPSCAIQTISSWC
jgi:catechol 2,3-dioxygenase-like lactoylglutathione lyase family enzyme